MDIRIVGAALAGACVAQAASGAIVVTTNQLLWTSAVTGTGPSGLGLSVETETFNAIADGFYTSPFGGSTPSVTWSAVAGGGLFVEGGVFSTNVPETLTFTFTPGVRAVAGNFFGTNLDFTNATVIFSVVLGDGTTYQGITEDASAFTGFRTTSASETIGSLSLTVANFGGTGSVFPSVDNLYFGVVPAPATAALLGVAGLVGFSMRRR